MPEPSGLVVWKGRKIRARSGAGTPWPLSDMRITSRSACPATASVTAGATVPAKAASAALWSSAHSPCVIWSRSHQPVAASGISTDSVTRSPKRSANRRARSSTSSPISTMARTGSGSLASIRYARVKRSSPSIRRVSVARIPGSRASPRSAATCALSASDTIGDRPLSSSWPRISIISLSAWASAARRSASISTSIASARPVPATRSIRQLLPSWRNCVCPVSSRAGGVGITRSSVANRRRLARLIACARPASTRSNGSGIWSNSASSGGPSGAGRVMLPPTPPLPARAAVQQPVPISQAMHSPAPRIDPSMPRCHASNINAPRMASVSPDSPAATARRRDRSKPMARHPAI